MTEDEWNSADVPQQMLSFVYNPACFPSRILERKSRPFALGCALSIIPHLHDARSRDAVDFMLRKCDCNFRRLRVRRELHAAAGEAAGDAVDRCEAAGELADYRRRRVRADAARVAHSLLDPQWWIAALDCGMYSVAVAGGVALLSAGSADTPTEHVATTSAQTEQSRINASLLRDIFGNPFRPVAFSPEWRTDTAVSLARRMYDARDFALMPILADALQDAGCEDADVLAHCRDPHGTHVRGCWVVDLVLGKS